MKGNANRGKFAHESLESYHRYIEQQDFIDKVAARLGIVAYRPDYHRSLGDKNTVLFYLPEDEAHNRAVDQEPIHYSPGEARDLRRSQGQDIPQKYIYRSHFWSFENSDVNGFGSYDYANHGRVALKSHRWQESLEGHMRLALTKRLQFRYVAMSGGWFALREADQEYNDFNRELIGALKMAHGTAFLGNVNFYGEEHKSIAAGKGSVYTEYTGQLVCNFDYTFCVPAADEELEKMIRAWNADDTLPKKGVDIEAITGRIEEIGGINLIWF